MKPPPKDPPVLAELIAMAARKAELEARREELFPLWKVALEEAEGNITKAGREHAEPLRGILGKHFHLIELRDGSAFDGLNYWTAHWLTLRLGLVKYARELRAAAGIPLGPGRPKGS